MDPSIRQCARRALEQCKAPQRKSSHLQHLRYLATPSEPREPSGEIQAARPIRLQNNPNQFSRLPGQNKPERRNAGGRDRNQTSNRGNSSNSLRIVPASPSYFTATPRYTDDFLTLANILRKYQLLPTLPNGQGPRVAWKSLEIYKTELAEPVRSKTYNHLIGLLKRLNQIHPAVFPMEVEQTLEKFKRDVQPSINVPRPITVNAFGLARAVGRRKASTAQVWLVEGDGQSMVNGRTLTDYFTRLHDRESALWALKATQRLDKYNVWVIVSGGGTTGQAEAITLGLAKALMAHEPDLKPALRRAGVVARDPRSVERKKAGHVKARKMPTWVKR